MHKLGRILLWIIPFTWPIALWRSVRHGQEKRHRELLEIVGVTPQPVARPAPRRHPVAAVAAVALLAGSIVLGGGYIILGLLAAIVVLALSRRSQA